MIARSDPEAASGPGDAIRTRDWAWGLLAAIVVGILVPLLLVWLFIGSAQCGTRPAAGYPDGPAAGYPDAGTTSCGSPG